MERRTVIGLEVHVQLATRTKLFCGCSTQFGQEPNSATCPVCMGLPGALPVLNGEAFRLGAKAALALNCRIAPFTKWDRKNYFYPDLPKNYQISQYDLPLGADGWLDVETSTGPRRIRILRAHLEEDAGKMLHDESGRGRDSLVDLNRTGTPLLEIVSHPDLETAEEAKAYLEEMRLLLREIGVSDCEMQEGSLRCDANVNVHLAQADGTFVASPIVEIKNLNTFRGLERAIKHEIDRQSAETASRLGRDWFPASGDAKPFAERRVRSVVERREGGREVAVSKATAGWDERFGRTEIQRRKEEAADYRYFPDPDLAPARVAPEQVEALRREMGELPAAQRARLPEQYGISPYDAGVLTRHGRELVAYFERAVGAAGDAKETCNWIANDLLQALNERKIAVRECPLPAERLGELVALGKRIGLNKQRARDVFSAMMNDGLSAQEAVDRLGIKPVADESELRAIVRRAIAASEKAVADYRKGKVKAADAIKGLVMRETKGSAKMETVQRLLLEELDRA